MALNPVQPSGAFETTELETRNYAGVPHACYQVRFDRFPSGLRISVSQNLDTEIVEVRLIQGDGRNLDTFREHGRLEGVEGRHEEMVRALAAHAVKLQGRETECAGAWLTPPLS